MTSVLALFRATFRSALPLKRTILFGLLELTPALLFVLSAENRTGEAAFDTLVEVGASSYFALLVPVVALVLGASALGSERRDQTLSFIVLRPIRRSVVGATKILATACAAIAINAVGAVALWAVFSIQHHTDADILVGLLVGMAVAVVAYVSIIVPLGFVTDRAVVIGLGFLLVFENGVVFALPGLATLSPWRIGAAAFGGITTQAQPILDNIVGNLTISTGGSVFTALIYLAVGVSLTGLLLAHRDLA
ncbi:MAG: ABC transporter permease [Acidimicrobiia bacterium]|nr:ABC transporter permease [Acidimicrobiia bacterium]